LAVAKIVPYHRNVICKQKQLIMKQIAFLIILILPLAIHGQNCDCISNFEWVKKTFEENDAGFAHSIQSKGELAYKLHNEDFLEKVKLIKDPSECYQTLYQWLRFFRSGHIAIRPLNYQPGSSENSQPQDDQIINKYKDWEKVSINLQQFKSSLSTQDPSNIEGIWVSQPYEIGIKKSGEEYVGFIIKADGVYWREGQVKLKIREDGSVVFYMRDHSAQNFDSFQYIGKNILEMGFITLERKFPEYETEENIERYFRMMNTQGPIFEVIDEQTNILRISSFAGAEKAKIDSLIAYHKEKILSTPNLIIDIRNNGGGDDRSYYELLPIIYTNSIRTVGLEFLSTPLNNQRMKDFATNPEYGFEESEVKQYKTYHKILSNNIGKFVNLDSTLVDLAITDTVYQYPKNVGIIINGGNGSTAEQFLLAAKQSKKVKLFGTRTYGSLDISNMNFVKSPCEEFELGYCLSKSFRIPDMAIDEVGIQPDYYINKTIPKYKWIDFVTEILNE